MRSLGQWCISSIKGTKPGGNVCLHLDCQAKLSKLLPHQRTHKPETQVLCQFCHCVICILGGNAAHTLPLVSGSVRFLHAQSDPIHQNCISDGFTKNLTTASLAALSEKEISHLLSFFVVTLPTKMVWLQWKLTDLPKWRTPCCHLSALATWKMK